jgi:23S rRNA pseudouridine2605 synthase
MTHPKHKIEKKYSARVKGIVQQGSLKKLEQGIKIDKYQTAPAKTKLRQVDKKNDASVVEIIIHEGKYHQVKRMFEAIGHPVKTLKRISYANLNCDGLRMGEYRRLKPHEVKQLKHLAKFGK